ncbi:MULTISPECIES: hypothetical protein [Aliagarivorans]|uniref:hypothetical protein n=1 Tax=Aliagarivorans TaxID=882379 RepID=UPI00040F0F80|nr:MULTISPECIES: hypothetical protein [Aliagarivorans]
MARFFLLPLILSVFWTLILFRFGKSMKDGRLGYYIIIGGSTFLIGFFSLMMYLTR